jgi:hypothetical protein
VRPERLYAAGAILAASGASGVIDVTASVVFFGHAPYARGYVTGVWPFLFLTLGMGTVWMLGVVVMRVAYLRGERA